MVLTLDDVRKRAQGYDLQISDWHGKEKITVRVLPLDLTPEIMQTISAIDVVPNKVKKLFEGKSYEERMELADQVSEEIDPDGMGKLLSMLNVIAKAVLVEPSFDEIEKILPLTLKQKGELFAYALKDLNDLSFFR